MRTEWLSMNVYSPFERVDSWRSRQKMSSTILWLLWMKCIYRLNCSMWLSQQMVFCMNVWDIIHNLIRIMSTKRFFSTLTANSKYASLIFVNYKPPRLHQFGSHKHWYICENVYCDLGDNGTTTNSMISFFYVIYQSGAKMCAHWGHKWFWAWWLVTYHQNEHP